MFTQGVYYKCGRNVYLISLLKQLPVVVLALIILVVIARLPAVVSQAFWWGLLLLIIYMAIAAIQAWYLYSSHVFMLDDYALHIRSGILNRNEVAIPYRQIQDVSLDESYIERMFGVSELNIMTAGHEDNKRDKSSAEFPLIGKVLAVALQEELSKRSSVQQVSSDKKVL
jgi:uncharacterized membrane protein YdbT with pleckstrin-like domain